MIGLDTNVVLRLLLDDDSKQWRAVQGFVQELNPTNPAYLSLIVMMELHWVLRSRYSLPRDAILEMFASLLTLSDLVVEDRGLVEEAISIVGATRADFSDVVIALRDRDAGCLETMTFDRAAAKLPDMRLLT